MDDAPGEFIELDVQGIVVTIELEKYYNLCKVYDVATGCEIEVTVDKDIMDRIKSHKSGWRRFVYHLKIEQLTTSEVMH